MEKPKVLFIIPSLKAGGAENVTVTITKELNKNLFDVYLLVLNSDQPFYTFDIKDSVSLILFSKKKVRNSFFDIIKTIYKIRPEIIFSTITHLNIYLGLLKPLFFSNVKLIVRESNVISSLLNVNVSFRENIFLKFLKISYSNASIVLCQSTFMKNEMLQFTGISEDKLAIINNPVSLPIEESNNINYSFDLLAVGNFSKIKGYERMLKILSSPKLNDVKLCIIGDGNERNNIEDLIDYYGLNNQVILLGHKKNPYSFMKSAKLLIMTSHYESFPNVVLEAGLAGLPTVAFNVPGGLSEILTNKVNGFLVNNDSHDSFVNAILEGLSFDFDRKDISYKTNRNFGVKKIVKQYEELLKNILV